MSSSIEIKGLDQEAKYFGPPYFVEPEEGVELEEDMEYDQGAIYDVNAIQKAIEAGLSFLDNTVRFSSYFSFSASCFCFFPNKKKKSFSLSFPGFLT